MAVVLTLVGCNRQTVYSHFEAVDTDGWERSDSVHFLVPPIMADGSYEAHIHLRTLSSYPYANLSLIVSQTILPSGLQQCDTINYLLTDDDGNPLVKGIDHFLYDATVPAISLSAGDTLQVGISHIMKRENLPGITDIGLTLHRHQ